MRVPFAVIALIAAAPARAGGTIAGSVTWQGPPPALDPVDRSADPACGAAPPSDRPYLVSASGGLQNVVIEIVGPTYEDTPHEPDAPAPPITVEQRQCAYVPRVQVARRGRPIQVRNTDAVLHNLHAFAGRKALFNVAQPPGSAPVTRPSSGDVVRLKCDIHPWMLAWVLYTDSAFAAVSDARGGFSFQSVPAGDYRARAWHELFGVREIPVHVRDGQVTSANLVFDAKAATGSR